LPASSRDRADEAAHATTDVHHGLNAAEVALVRSLATRQAAPQLVEKRAFIARRISRLTGICAADRRSG
jgi:hypothetical protein